MAQGKKSFQMYTEWIEVFNELDNEDAGQLIKHIFKYVNDENPISENKLVSLSFIQIKQQLKRDLKKWIVKSETNKVNGAKGGRPRNPKEPKETERLISEPKKPVEVKVEVKEEVEVKEDLTLYPSFDDFWILYDKKSGNKKKCLSSWSKNNQAVKESIMVHLNDYVKSTPDKQYRKNPETYLNQSHWENEILITNSISNGKEQLNSISAEIRNQYTDL